MSEIVYKRCPKCGSIMKVRENVLTSSIPPFYIYDCPDCGAVDYDKDMYPYFEPPKVNHCLTCEPTEASFTLRFRCETARDILCAILSTKTTAGDSDIDIAIEITDMLIRKLKETEKI